MTKFSVKTLRALQAAGWIPDRRVNIDSFISNITAKGYAPIDSVVTFLSEYGGLKIPLERMPGTNIPGFLVVDPRQ